jgi:hypothetical protein
MKKKIISIAFVAAIAVTTAWNFIQSKTEVELSDLALANVEALASGENSGSGCSGCSSIGWGWNKVLECDCNYDHFSDCDRWGC